MIEIKEFHGERLSPLSDFHENSIKGPQHVDIQQYRLTVTGLVGKPFSLTCDEVIKGHKSFQKLIKLDCVEGWSVTILWEGILLKDLLQPANVKPHAKTVILHCADGYTTALPLDYLVKKDIILAYRMNGIRIPPERGFPFHLVAESKWGYKWARWVTSLELSDKTDYKGYWEQRGYCKKPQTLTQ